jgi:hypothetical protein
MEHSGGNIKGQVNAGTVISVASGNTNSLGSRFNMGKGYGGAYSDIEIMEMVFSNTVWSQPIIEKAAGKLAHKYGLQSLLPIDHTYKSTPPFA